MTIADPDEYVALRQTHLHTGVNTRRGIVGRRFFALAIETADQMAGVEEGVDPKPQINNGFGHQTTMRANRRRRGTCDSSDENSVLSLDNVDFP
ncbi:hypothetical protein [Mycolicibacterium aromaticivorans]|uniref:hypothetical protein n=1 Tax=Mycolicibacterium aromaticivorans TaxID=318425 RepID=UPI001038B6AD|nr:hypothetical protein [Mycolicibacterium aromaticivorans]